MSSPSLTLSFAGQHLVLDAMGALYWPSERVLVGSDLHFEKSTFLAQHGSPIAPYDTHDTLERLETLVAHYEPRELIFLGDSFHDCQAWHRLEVSLRARLAALTDRVEHCHWIEGNHDRKMLQHTIGVEMQHKRSNILFAHEHEPAAPFQIIGHYHPKMRVSAGGSVISGKCFVHLENILIMPAFGTYTGGLDIAHPALQQLKGNKVAHYYLLYRQNIYRRLPKTNALSA